MKTHVPIFTWITIGSLTFQGLLPVASGDDDKKSIEDPLRLVRLRESYDRAVERTISPVEQVYLKHLESLLADFTQSNRLDDALEVRKEIEALKSLVADRKQDGAFVEKIDEVKKSELTKNSLSEYLQGSEFSWQGNTAKVIMQFKDDDVFVYANGNKIMEKAFEIIEPNIVEFEWSSGDRNQFILDKNWKSFERKSAKAGIVGTGVVSKRSKMD